MYTSKFIDEALADVKKLPKNVRNALRGKFKKKIHIDPVGCSEPLEGLLADYRSFHYGDYRVIYRVFEDIKAVSVVGVGKKERIITRQSTINSKLSPPLENSPKLF